MVKTAAQPRSRRPRRRRSARNLRRVALLGAPLALAAGLLGGAVLSGALPARGSAASQGQGFTGSLLGLTGKLGLVVADIQVDGRTTTDRATILAALDAHAGTPMLAVSPARAKQQLEALPWVRSAAIERRFPDTLYVHLVERRPLGVWQHDGGKFDLIDRDGAVIPVTDLSRFAKLPSVIGDDQARRGAAQLLDMLAGEPELAGRVSAVTLVGDRRWNVRIDTIDVMLPEDDMASAWAKLARLEHSNRILQRDVAAIDMRLPDRLVVRVTETAPKDAPGGKKNHSLGKST